MASIEQPPDTMFQQIKRPLDMNSLEKGPPAAKIQRVGHKQIHEVPTSRLCWEWCVCVCVYVHMCVCMCVYVCVCVCVYIHVYACVYVHAHACVYVHVFVSVCPHVRDQRLLFIVCKNMYCSV